MIGTGLELTEEEIRHFRQRIRAVAVQLGDYAQKLAFDEPFEIIEGAMIEALMALIKSRDLASRMDGDLIRSFAETMCDHAYEMRRYAEDVAAGDITMESVRALDPDDEPEGERTVN